MVSKAHYALSHDGVCETVQIDTQDCFSQSPMSKLIEDHQRTQQLFFMAVTQNESAQPSGAFNGAAFMQNYLRFKNYPNPLDRSTISDFNLYQKCQKDPSTFHHLGHASNLSDNFSFLAKFVFASDPTIPNEVRGPTSFSVGNFLELTVAPQLDSEAKQVECLNVAHSWYVKSAVEGCPLSYLTLCKWYHEGNAFVTKTDPVIARKLLSLFNQWARNHQFAVVVMGGQPIFVAEIKQMVQKAEEELKELTNKKRCSARDINEIFPNALRDFGNQCCLIQDYLKVLQGLPNDNVTDQ